MLFKTTIPLVPVTKKNSQRIVTIKGRPMILPSKKYKQYETDCMPYLKGWLDDPISCAVNVKCIYYMPTKRRVDLTNLMEATHDILVNYGILQDDHSGIIVSVDGSRVLYDKEKPRAEIVIEEVKV